MNQLGHVLIVNYKLGERWQFCSAPCIPELKKVKILLDDIYTKEGMREAYLFEANTSRERKDWFNSKVDVK